MITPKVVIRGTGIYYPPGEHANPAMRFALRCVWRFRPEWSHERRDIARRAILGILMRRVCLEDRVDERVMLAEVLAALELPAEDKDSAEWVWAEFTDAIKLVKDQLSLPGAAQSGTI
jgi:hypothetical protein